MRVADQDVSHDVMRNDFYAQRLLPRRSGVHIFSGQVAKKNHPHVSPCVLEDQTRKRVSSLSVQILVCGIGGFFGTQISQPPGGIMLSPPGCKGLESIELQTKAKRDVVFRNGWDFLGIWKSWIFFGISSEWIFPDFFLGVVVWVFYGDVHGT